MQLGENQIKASPFALLIDLHAQNIPVPMYLAPGSYALAADIINLNFELGAFLRIDPVFAEK